MSTALLPADADQRRRLTTELTHTLFVEAGAGTGKTTQLVARIVELVTTGALDDVSRLTAITFTEAAAAELRHRVRERLEADVAARPPGDPARERAVLALDRLDSAAIATLHSFAARLLGEFPVEAGLPPGFEVADEIAALVEDRERWADFLDELFADEECEPILRRALGLGLTARHLAEVAAAFADNWDRLEGLGFRAHGLTPVETGGLVAALDRAIASARGCTGEAKSITRTIEQLVPFRDRLVAEVDPEHRLLVLLHERPEFPRFGNATRPELVDLRAEVDAVRDELDGLVGRLRLDALEPLLARLRDHARDGAEQRRQEGRVRFHDLLVLARDLLAGHPEVRAELSRRHGVVLVDEFQDTDPLQVEIALLLTLADPLPPPPPRWDDAVTADGALFFVGDPKQSIYRFRRADIAVFERARRRFTHHGPVELRVNFRTVPSVLRWVNAVFGRLFGAGDPHEQPPYRALDAAREDLTDDPAVVLLGGEVEADSVASLREIEAGHVAELITEAVGRGWLVGAGRHHDTGTRPARYGDVAVLIPTRAVLSELERALEARGVPYRIESRSLVFATDEVRELLAVLQAIDDPEDSVAVVAALRSPGLACPDDALARYRLAGGSWHPCRPVPDKVRQALPADDPVLAGLTTLAELHDARLWSPVNELVARVVRDLSLVELTTAHDRPRDHWRRIRLVMAEARAFVESGGQALADFIAHIEQQADERATRIESVVADPDDDAVRIVTVHGSKGLEYPIAVLAGLGTEYRPPTDRVVWTEGGVEIALGPQKGTRFETAGYREAIDREKRLDRAERVRLLYVAATRARDRLVVSLLHRPERDCLARDVVRVLGECADGHLPPEWRHVPVDGPAPSTASPRDVPLPTVGDQMPVLPLGPPAPLNGRVESGPGAGAGPGQLALFAAGDEPAPPPPWDPLTSWEQDRHRLLDRVAAASVTTPTALAAGATPSGAPGAAGGTVPAGGNGATGAAIGRAVHGTMRLIDLTDPEPGLAGLATAQAAREGVAAAGPLVERLVRSLLGAPVVAAAGPAPRRWREVSVTAPLGARETLVEGFIDLLYETLDGRLVVVDYKTDRAPDDRALDAACRRYRPQAAAYAAALARSLGRPVDTCVLVFARDGGPAVERPVEDLAAAVEEVVRSLG